MSKPIVYLCVLVAFQLCCMHQLHAAQIRVPEDHPTIQSAIVGAADGDVVVVSPGRYVEGINFLGKGITVQSTDPEDQQVVDATIVDGGKAGSCVTIGRGNDCALLGLTITSGSTDYIGGGIYCSHTRVTIANNTIIGNYARVFGGGLAICDADRAVVVGNRIIGNTALDLGGGILLFDVDQARVEGNTITSNACRDGAGIYGWANAQIIGNTISDNVGVDYASPAFGAGIEGYPLTGLIAENTLIGNSAPVGGAFGAHWAYDLAIVNNLISGTTAGDAFHHCIYINLAEGVLFAGNQVIDNRTPGIFIADAAPAVFVDNTVAGNDGTGLSAGQYDTSAVNVIGNVIACNRGGGVKLTCGGFLANNLIAGNSTDSDGGGVILDQGAPILLNNTIIGNRATDSGGGIRAYRSRALIANTILQGNTASHGSEVHVDGEEPISYQASLTVKNSNIAGGEAAAVIGDFATLTWGPGNIDADPLFVDPGHWDGGTFILGDYHLLPGSPCIDAGTNDVDNPDTTTVETLPATDIAGLARVTDGDLDAIATVDIGAYEYLPGDVNYDGKVNVIDLLIVRNSLGRDPASSIEARKADVNADGAVNVEDLLVVRGRLGR
ncbi:MAG TPA: right-handed parallel beta-helix repeat-containing protein [Planctomycetota bacterium]|nr:right-handed parallel beta-helix repeat-containing protein [Planctomycetota bacterium]